MITSATHKLARELVYNYERSAKWNKPIILAWAERILMQKQDPPSYLMKPLDGKKIWWSKDKTSSRFSQTEEGDTLIQLRDQYANETKRVHRVS